MKRLFSLATAACVVAATTLHTQAQTEPDGRQGGGFTATAPSLDAGLQDKSPLGFQFQTPLSDAQTNRLVRLLGRAEVECASVIIEHRIDCLAQAFGYAARQATGPQYAEASRTLNTLSRELSAVVRKSIDRTKTPVEAPRRDRQRPGRRTYRAVKPAAVPAANREARAAVDKATNRLLRSAQRSAKRRTHYQQIAQAVGSTKLLMRA